MEVKTIMKTQLAREIYEIAHLTGQFTLRSGQNSNEYFDKYLFESDPKILSKIAEGTNIVGRRICVIEDVITTGGQVVLSTNDLREAGAIVEDVICVIERNPEGRKKLEEIGLKVHSLFKMEELNIAGNLIEQ